MLILHFRSGRNVFEEKAFGLTKKSTNSWHCYGPKNACSYADLAMGEIDFQGKFSGPIKPAL